MPFIEAFWQDCVIWAGCYSMRFPNFLTGRSQFVCLACFSVLPALNGVLLLFFPTYVNHLGNKTIKLLLSISVLLTVIYSWSLVWIFFFFLNPNPAFLSIWAAILFSILWHIKRTQHSLWSQDALQLVVLQCVNQITEMTIQPYWFIDLEWATKGHEIAGTSYAIGDFKTTVISGL